MKFGPEAPAWAQGRTAEEILGLAVNMAEALKLQQQAPPPPAPNGGLPTDQQWMTTPNDAARAVVTSTVAPQMAAMTQTMAGMVRGIAQTQFSDEFKRWGPEIDSYIAKMPVENRTLDNIETVVKLVRGNHVDDLVSERVQAKLAQTGGLGERADGSSAGGMVGATGVVNFDQLPQSVGDVAKRMGLTPQHVQDAARAMGLTTEQWMKMAQDQKVITSTSPFTFTMTEEALGATRSYT